MDDTTTTYRSRPASMEDLGAVADMIEAADLADSGTVDFSPRFLEHDWTDPRLDLGRDTWLVEAPDGAIAGYGFVLSRGPDTTVMGWGVVHPGHRGRGVGTRLVDLREGRARELAGLAPNREVRLHSDVTADDAVARRLHEHRGYQVVRHFWRMDIELSEPPPTLPAAPPGIEVRTFVRGRDDRAVHGALQEAFADHWEHVPRPFEQWAAHNLKPDLDPGLWYLARDGEEVAGALLGEITMGVGFVDVLGVRRPWRRRGVATLLLGHSFQEFHRRGLREARLYVDAQNPTGATDLYERVGMHVGRSYLAFEKLIPADDEPHR